MTFSVPNLAAGQRYYFAVQAYNTSGLTSPYSAEVLRNSPAVAPTLVSVAPDRGPSTGGTAIALTGTGFTAGTSVVIGGVAATAVTVLSANAMTAVTGAHALGVADVVVTVPDRPRSPWRAHSRSCPRRRRCRACSRPPGRSRAARW